MTYTHDVQYAHFRWDQVEERGQVDVRAAVATFRSFPFKAQQQEARMVAEPTCPTIAYRSKEDGAVLSVWSLEPDQYEVYLEVEGEKVTVDEDEAGPIEEAIAAFFAGQRRELFEHLASQKGAVVKRGFWGRARWLVRR